LGRGPDKDTAGGSIQKRFKTPRNQHGGTSTPNVTKMCGNGEQFRATVKKLRARFRNASKHIEINIGVLGTECDKNA
jgi:hypothetical protein